MPDRKHTEMCFGNSLRGEDCLPHGQAPNCDCWCHPMTPSEPQAGQQLWRVETRMLAGTVQDYEITELVAPTGDRFQDFAPSLVSMLNDAALRADVLAEALERVEGYVGCGDNSCLFKKPTGMATNGGCRCVRSGRPGVAPALAELYKAVALLAPKAAGGA